MPLAASTAAAAPPRGRTQRRRRSRPAQFRAPHLTPPNRPPPPISLPPPPLLLGRDLGARLSREPTGSLAGLPWAPASIVPLATATSTPPRCLVSLIGAAWIGKTSVFGDVVDIDMEDSLDSGVEYEIVDDEEEHEELGGLAFEPEIVDPIPSKVDAEAPEPMDVDEHVQHDLQPQDRVGGYEF
ncbi:hypothetical protein NL676_019418 [Syzygium grande]|nr:hypothetical protein NL676_019418 [Syzygium grande]